MLDKIKSAFLGGSRCFFTFKPMWDKRLGSSFGGTVKTITNVKKAYHNSMNALIFNSLTSTCLAHSAVIMLWCYVLKNVVFLQVSILLMIQLSER